VIVLVVGGSGMLGTALVSVLGKDPGVELYATRRTAALVPPCGVKEWFRFRAGCGEFPPLLELGPEDWIVNAAGAIPQRPLAHAGALGMVQANALLPYELAQVCDKTGARMVNVATDCVFSGSSNHRAAYNFYRERDVHDAKQFYGRTKSMGEVLHNRRALNLRCSIVGPEPGGRGNALLDWFLSHPRTTPITGYGDHLWNGVTTLALSRVIQAVIRNAEDLDFGALPRVHHLVPKGQISKACLLRLFARHFDVPSKVEVRNVGEVDRTLGTSHPELNNRLWVLAGYEVPPTIEEMVAELARWVRSGGYLFRKEVPK
jgi:dTDP-4-dehydrorhamnose reductase